MTIEFDFVPLLFWEILARSCRGALLVLLIFAVRAVFRKQIAPAWRMALWLLVPAALFWPKLPASPYSVENWTGETTEILQRELPQRIFPVHETAESDSLPRDSNPVFNAAASEPVSVTPTGETLVHDGATHGFAVPVFVGLWLVVILILTGRIFRKTLAFRRLLDEAVPVTDPIVLDRFTHCMEAVGAGRIRLFESPDIAGPTLCGIFRPKIVLPAGLAASLEPERLEHVFLHEWAHWRRGDLLTGWLTTLALTVHWFNPVLWLAARSVVADREEACDALAMNKLESRAEYGETLLLLSSQLSESRAVRIVPGVAGIMESKSFLSRRIEAVVSSRKFPLYVKLFCVLAVILLAVTLLTRSVQRDGSEKLFGVVPIPKKKVPNRAEITFTKISRENDSREKKEKITVRGKILPIGAQPLEKARITGTQFLDTLTSSLGAEVRPDGSFEMFVYQNAEIVLFFEDDTKRLAAPPYTFKTFEPEKTLYEPLIPVYPARHVSAVVRDAETGEPLPGICFDYTPLYGDDFLIGGPGRSRFNWRVYSDAEGKFSRTVSTGEYLFSLASVTGSCFSDNGGGEDEAVFARKVTITENSPEPVEIVFELPKLFRARLLNPDGGPAKNQSVSFRGYGWNNGYFSTTTDGNGDFQLHKAPEFVEMTVNSPSPYRSRGREYRLQRWFARELTAEPDKIWEFRLQEAAAIRARFVDGNGKPITEFSIDTLRCNKPGDESTRSNNSWGFNVTKTDVPGEFVFPYATPGVEYRFSGQFPGIRRRNDTVLTATTAEGGQMLDLGDVVIEDQPPVSTPVPFVPPRRLPIRVVFPSGEAVTHYDYVNLTLHDGGSTSWSDGSVSGRSHEKIVPNPGERHWEILSLRDPANRWAARPIIWSPDEDWDSKTEIRVTTEPGEMIRGTVLDETTGKPVAEMPVALLQKIALEGDAVPSSNRKTLEWKLKTDAQGRFAVRMVPGEFGIGIGDTYAAFGNAPEGNRNKERWTRNVRLETGKPVDTEFRIPTPFAGRVLTTAGHPAVEAKVEYCLRPGSYTWLRTDKKGEFRLYRAPEPFSYMTFESNDPMDKAQRLIRWIEPGETDRQGTPDRPMVFRLSNIDVTGRLLDMSGQPLRNNRSIYVSAERPETAPNHAWYKRAAYYRTESAWNPDGSFRVSGLAPDVKYTLRYNGNPGEDAVIVVPAEEGNLIDLGDLKVEP